MGFAAVALLGVLPGIVVAVIASLLALIRRAYRPRISVLGRAADETSADEDYRFRSIDRHPEYRTIPGLVLFRFSNELFFANASYFRDETLRLVAEADPPARTVLVDAGGDQPSRHDGGRDAGRPDRAARGGGRHASSSPRARSRCETPSSGAACCERLGPDALHRSVHTGVAGVPRPGDPAQIG